MKKIVIITLAILVISFMLFAQKPNKPAMDNNHHKGNGQGMMAHGDGGMGMHKEMVKELNLSKEQQKKFDAMRDDHMKYMNTKQAEMENLQIDKHNAMQAEQFDKAKQINKNINDLELVIANAMVDHKAAMLKELTPEQKAKFQEMKPMGMKGHGMGMGKGNKDCKGMGKGHGMDDKKGPCSGDCK